MKFYNLDDKTFETDFSENGRECVIRFGSLPHFITCNRDKGIKVRPGVFWDLNITFTLRLTTFSEKKTVNSNVLSLKVKCNVLTS